MSMVFSVQTGVKCESTQNFGAIPLPASKLQWEANSHATWEQRRITENNGLGELRTIANLLEVHQKYEEPVFAQKLDSWNAKQDQSGSLLNLAVSLVV
jgi:hypothetical protein